MLWYNAKHNVDNSSLQRAKDMEHCEVDVDDK